jgi:hypothetical protein
MKHTPGPWAWFGSPDSRGFYLATTHSGRRYVMDFVRMGMNRAQPRFQVNGLMEDGKDLCQFEVAPHVIGIEAARKEGSGVYRKDITGFAHPDAKLIAAAPELLQLAKDLLEQVEDEWPGCALVERANQLLAQFE